MSKPKFITGDLHRLVAAIYDAAPDGLQVGCTTVPWPEIEALHAKLCGPDTHGKPPTK